MLGKIAAIASIASGVVGIGSSIMSGNAQAAQNDAQAAAAKREAKRKQEASRLELAKGDRVVQMKMREQEIMQSNALAAAGASGFNPVATMGKISSDIAAEFTNERDKERYNAEMAARGYTISANEDLAAASNFETASKSAQTGGRLGAVGSAAGAFGGWYGKFGGGKGGATQQKINIGSDGGGVNVAVRKSGYAVPYYGSMHGGGR